MRHEPQFFHACKMVKRNLRSYAMLSITIVFSFTILFGYLAFTDSALFNDYKEIFSSNREIVMAYTFDETEQMDALVRQVEEKVEDTSCYRYFETSTILTQYGGTVRANVTVLPERTTLVFQDICDAKIGENYSKSVKIVQGEGFPLSGNQVIVNESFFRSLSPEGTLPVELSIPISLVDGTRLLWHTEVVGVCEDIDEKPLAYDKEGKLYGQTQIYVSQSIMGSVEASSLFGAAKYVVLFRSSSPEVVAGFAQNFDLVLHAVCIAQNTATEKIRIQTETKLIIAIALYILLGINLFGCFSNALSERKFEIGVKRAIGAPSRAIVGQFLAEGLVVMLCNTLLSVLLTVDVLAIYKLYQHYFCNTEWIVSVSSHSVLMFAVCSLGLTVVFSIFFAFRATRVQIVDYLKAE